MRSLNLVPTLLALCLLGCGLGEIDISISPKEVHLNPTMQQQFAAKVTNAGNKTVLWTVTGGGTITDTGLFTAPAAEATCTVTAACQADPSKTASAQVTVSNLVTVTPSRVTVVPSGTQAFSAMVTATWDTNINWSILEGAEGGAITSSGVYTAPAVTGTYHVVATSVADATKFGQAVVTVAPVN